MIYKKKLFLKPGNYWELADEVFSRIHDNNRENFVNFMEENEHIAKRRGINIANRNEF